MTKLLNSLIGVIVALIAIPLMASCSNEDEPENPKETEYIKTADWDVKTIKEERTSVVLQSKTYKERWGVFYSKDKSTLMDFKNLFILSTNDDLTEWSKLVARVIVLPAEGSTTVELTQLDSNTVYYYVAFYDECDDVTNKLIGVYYTDIQSFTTTE